MAREYIHTFYVTKQVFDLDVITGLSGYYADRFPKIGAKVRILLADGTEKVRMTTVCTVDEKAKTFDVSGGKDGSIS